MSIRPDANDTFIFIPETSPVSTGAFTGRLTIDGFVLNAVQTDDAGVGSLRITKAGAVTLTATLDDGLLLPAVKTDDDDGLLPSANNVNLGAAGTVTLGGDIQFLDDGLLNPANNVSLGAAGTVPVNNGGDIILSGIGTLGDIGGSNTYGGTITLQNATTIGALGDDASSSLADWTIL